ncbi:LysE family translocator [Enterovibrio makurazakiensis]|uniref:LysE family translocator n=1 Tax=Enterovibrio gelatinilyticus TaxID=2899819 RepID=A0ABT5QVZ4_9GAMM|nr:LysE family translocator [Enterovibrio sp. ZSDZ42]MDD1792184.1 LysE family translocator [Enterovibrio sp. ZSDZ42]
MVSIEFLVTSIVVVLIPGTGVLYTISTGLLMGFRASIWASVGCTFGIIPSLIASITGLAIILHTSALAFQVVKYAGVAYLMYLAVSMWRSSGALSLNDKAKNTSMYDIAIKGCLMNILNPKLTVFFMAFLPQFVPASIVEPAAYMLLLGSIFMTMTFVVFIFYGALAVSVRDFIIHSERASIVLQRVFAGSFAALGLKLAFSDKQ